MKNWWDKNKLWIVGFGLMLASSGLDGVYMALWMPAKANWLGFILNTVADYANMKLGQEFGKLQRSRIKEKRQLAKLLFVGEAIAILYSWFFSWRQLRRVLPLVEPEHWVWVAPIAAGFIPLTLAFLGIAQSLQVASRDILTDAEPEPAKATPKPLSCPVCGATSGKSGKPFLSQDALRGHMRAHSGNGHKAPEAEPVPAGSKQ